MASRKKPRKKPAPRRAPVAPAGSVKRMANGRWRYVATGRIAPEVNGKPIPVGWRKDKNGIPYNVEKRRKQAIRNFGTERKRGKKPAQSANLGVRAGLTLWKGPPRPRWPTVYGGIAEIRRMETEPARKRAALTAWCNDHAVPATKRPKGDRKHHRMMNHWDVTVSRHAKAWATLTLSYFASRNEWIVDRSNSISDDPNTARELGEESRELPPSPRPGDIRESIVSPDGEQPADRLSVHVPIRPMRQ